MNCKHTDWNSPVSNNNGTKLKSYIDNTNLLIIHPVNYTHYPYNSNYQPSTIDIGIISNLTPTTPKTLDPLDSDHLPVLIKIKTTNPFPLQTYNHQKQINWSKFKNLLKNEPKFTEIQNIDQLEKSIYTLTNQINTALNNATKINKNPSQKINLPTPLLNKIKQNRKLRKKYNNRPDPTTKNDIKNLTLEINNEINELKANMWINKLSKITLNNKNALWPLARSLKKSKTKNSIPPLINPTTNSKAYSDTEKANLLASTFQKVHHMNDNLGDETTIKNTNKIINTFKRIDTPTPLNSIPTLSELNKIISKLKPNKAPGQDQISGQIIKNLPINQTKHLLHILQNCIKFQHFPNSWKNALIIPIKKPNKDHSQPTNYRPISLLPIFSKILESVILSRLNYHLKSNNILIQEQFGFKTKHNTTLQLARVSDQILVNRNNNKITSLITLDIEKAFDTVWHNGLILKLLKIKTPHHLIKIIISFLENRTFQTLLNNKISKKQSISSGVPQGAVLSPTLFNIYINDIPKSNDTKLALFADDTAIISSSWQAYNADAKSQKHLDEISNYFKKWKIKINANKTNITYFTHHKTIKNKDITLNNTIITHTNVTKYLGLEMDKNLNFNSHINSTLKKAQNAFMTLFPLISFKSPINTETKAHIYKTYIRPIILYASPIWSITPRHNIEKIQKFQNKILRVITNSRKRTPITQLHELTKIQPIEPLIETINKKFYTKQIRKINATKNTATLNQQNTNFKYKRKMLPLYTQTQP